jgi:copper(I)-binding protein
MRMIIAVAALLALSGPAGAQTATKGGLVLSGLAVRTTPAGLPTSAAYMTIENHGKSADALLSVECACATSAMMHETRTQKGVSSMTMLGEVPVPAGGQVRFKPDGLHVMLVGLKGPLKSGTTQQMVLTFRKAGQVKAPFRVLDVIPAR